jgi:hypothetical protein
MTLGQHSVERVKAGQSKSPEELRLKRPLPSSFHAGQSKGSGPERTSLRRELGPGSGIVRQASTPLPPPRCGGLDPRLQNVSRIGSAHLSSGASRRGRNSAFSVPAITRNLHRAACVFAVLTTVFALLHEAIARGVGAFLFLLLFSHDPVLLSVHDIWTAG